MKKQSTKLIGIILCAIFTLLLVETYMVHKGGSNRPSPFGTHRRKPASEKDINYISSWMTFDYINQLFNLPKDYLAKEMNITDTKYPFLTIAKYAKETNTNPGLLILSIEDAVKKYMDTATPIMK